MIGGLKIPHNNSFHYFKLPGGGNIETIIKPIKIKNIKNNNYDNNYYKKNSYNLKSIFPINLKKLQLNKPLYDYNVLHFQDSITSLSLSNVLKLDKYPNSNYIKKLIEEFLPPKLRKLKLSFSYCFKKVKKFGIDFSKLPNSLEKLYFIDHIYIHDEQNDIKRIIKKKPLKYAGTIDDYFNEKKYIGKKLSNLIYLGIDDIFYNKSIQ